MLSFNTAFSIGAVPLTWNAIMLALGILVAVVVSEILVKKRGAYKDLALDTCIIGILTGLLGARLFAAISGKVAFSSFFILSQSGLNLPGALLFAGAAIAVYARIKKLPAPETFDLLLPGAFFGLAVGRWSDFFLCEGLGPVAGADGPKFFPVVTVTEQYFQDGRTVAYAVFFLDFLVCLALGVAALILSKKTKPGRTSRILIPVYLLAAFLLEWLRDASLRQTIGGVRFNQIAWLFMLICFAAVSLFCAKRRPDAKNAGDTPEETEPSPLETDNACSQLPSEDRDETERPAPQSPDDDATPDKGSPKPCQQASETEVDA